MKKDRLELKSQFDHPPITAPVDVVMKAYRVDGTLHFKRPTSHFKDSGGKRSDAPSRHTKRPDVDNLAKYVLDSLQPDILADDKYVALCTIQSINQKTQAAPLLWSPPPAMVVPARSFGRSAVRSKQSNSDGQQSLLRLGGRGKDGD